MGINKRCDNCPRLDRECVGLQEACEVDRNRLRNHILDAIRELYEKDRYLIEVNANEVCISAHFWYYFKQKSYSEYMALDIDPEYNRSGDDPKYYQMKTGEALHAAKPDMIIHKRGAINIISRILR